MKTTLAFGSREPSQDIPERRLWLAVLRQAVEDWRSPNLRQQRTAEEFLFGSHKDFGAVCSNAGINPGSLSPKLVRVKPHISIVRKS